MSLVCQASFTVPDGNGGEGATCTSDLLDSLTWPLLDPEPGDRLGLCVQRGGPENSPSGLIQPLPLPLCLHVFPQYYHMLFHDNMHLT